MSIQNWNRNRTQITSTKFLFNYLELPINITIKKKQSIFEFWNINN